MIQGFRIPGLYKARTKENCPFPSTGILQMLTKNAASKQNKAEML